MTSSAVDRHLGRVVATAAGAAVATRLWAAALRRRPPGGSARWTRTNYAGDAVSLLEGPAYVLGAGLAAAPAGPGAVIAVAGGGLLGVLDDLAGDSSSKGLRGHLAALRRGEVTTGALKVVGLAGAGTLAAAWVDRGLAVSPARRVVDAVLGGAVVAGTANLANLLDLRPGRALKVVLLGGGTLALTHPRSQAAAAAAGAAAAALPDDLAGSSMLGDTGANAAGALIGAALLERLDRRHRLVALGLIVAVTAASERVSFTRVIESTPILREVDTWGRKDRVMT